MSQEIMDQIKKEIDSNAILLFIKGSKEMPMCGFSARTIEVFNQLGRPFKTFDILPDPAIRQTLSGISSWPTIPQVFINGKFIGGCDIVMEMYQEGELKKLVEETVKAS